MAERDEIEWQGKRLVCTWRGLARQMLVPLIHCAAAFILFAAAARALDPPEAGTPAALWLEVLQSAAVAPPEVRGLVLTTGCEEHEECNTRCPGVTSAASTVSDEARSCFRDVSRSYIDDYPLSQFEEYVDLVDEALYGW